MALGCEWRHVRKWWAENFGDFWKKAVSWDLKLGEMSWFLSLGEGSPAEAYGMRRAFVGSDGTVSIIKTVSLCPRIEKTKTQKS